MSIGGNGANGPPRPPPSNNAELRRRHATTSSDEIAITIEEENEIGAPHNRPSLRERVFTGVRNTLSCPATVFGLIVCTISVGHVLSLLSGIGRSSNALVGGSGPALGGTPPPPALNPTQVGAAIPLMPAGGSPAPPLDQILRNANYSDQEQRDFAREGARPRGAARTRTRGRGHEHSRCREGRAQRNRAARLTTPQPEQTAEQPARASLPPCPPRLVFTTPDLHEDLGRFRVSEARQLLQNEATADICDGPTPEIAFYPPASAPPHYQCQNSETGQETTRCTSTDPNLECSSGEVRVQCGGLRLRNWGNSVGGACRNARDLNKPIVIVLEATNLPQDSGMPGDAAEQAAFDHEIRRFCPESVNIYSEEAPFDGASPWARERIRFNARPQDILQDRGRETAAEAQPAQEAEPQAATQDEMQNQTEDGAQGAGSSPPQDSQPSDKLRKSEQ